MDKAVQDHQEKRTPEIVAAIPCFNTGPYIADVVSRARKYVDRVIVVDDGSSDGTGAAAEAAGAEVISHPVNLGYGGAIQACAEAARAKDADILITLDGDGQHNPDEIPRLLAPILHEGADLVIGSRFITDEHNAPRHRRFGISVITFLWNFCSRVQVYDAQSGFRAYSREMLQQLHLSERGMSISIETLEIARRKGVDIREVPISCFYIPSFITLHATTHGFGVALSVLRIRCKGALHGLFRDSA